MIRLPSFMPIGREVNELFNKMMSATRRDAGAPAYIATPRSDFFSASASLTPSPTMPVNLPDCLK